MFDYLYNGKDLTVVRECGEKGTIMKITAVTNARVFDGEQVIGARTVVLDGAGIGAVGGPVPPGATVVDAGGGPSCPD